MRQIYNILIILCLSTYAFGATEDFNDYTVSGANSARITTQTSTKVEFVNLDAPEECIVYKDYDVNHFTGDFTHQFEVWTDNITNGSRVGFWGLSNVADTQHSLYDASENFITFYNYGGGGAIPQFHLRLYEGGALIDDDDSADTCDQEIVYFVTVARDITANTITATIRTGSHTGDVVDTLSITSGSEDAFRYLYCVQSYEGGSSADTSDGYVQNLDINEAEEEPPAASPIGSQVIIIF